MIFLKWILSYFRALIKSIGKLLIRYPLAAVASIFVIIGGILLVFMGKDIQIGGVLGKFFGSNKTKNERGVIPIERVDKNGQPLQPGKSDNLGYVQAPVYNNIKKPGFFDNPHTVTIIHPNKRKVIINLPEGVKNKDVKEVVEIKPHIYEIKNNDKNTSNVNEILKNL